jgi:hypothetical protein
MMKRKLQLIPLRIIGSIRKQLSLLLKVIRNQTKKTEVAGKLVLGNKKTSVDINNQSDKIVKDNKHDQNKNNKNSIAKINIEDIKDIKNSTQSKSQPKIDIQIQANKDNRVSK